LIVKETLVFLRPATYAFESSEFEHRTM